MLGTLSVRDPDRIDPTVEALARVWKKYPDLRLGQLIVIAAERDDPFHIEEDVMLQRLNESFGSDEDGSAIG